MWLECRACKSQYESVLAKWTCLAHFCPCCARRALLGFAPSTESVPLRQESGPRSFGGFGLLRSVPGAVVDGWGDARSLVR